jgi:hypothetical protein
MNSPAAASSLTPNTDDHRRGAPASRRNRVRSAGEPPPVYRVRPHVELHHEIRNCRRDAARDRCASSTANVDEHARDAERLRDVCEDSAEGLRGLAIVELEQAAESLTTLHLACPDRVCGASSTSGRRRAPGRLAPSMPPDQRLRFHHHDDLAPLNQPGQPDERQADRVIGSSRPDLPLVALSRGGLVAGYCGVQQEA